MNFMAFLRIGFGIVISIGMILLQDTVEQKYLPTDEIFSNPERGFIHTYSSLKDQNKLDKNELESLKRGHVSTILRIIYLEQNKSKNISKKKLKLISDDFKLIREQGLKVILRFAYTDSIGGEDVSLEWALKHITQLGPLIKSNEDVVAFMQAGFIGAWGEWHSSSNHLTSLENQRTILFRLLQVLPESIMVQVRTPLIKQQIFASEDPINSNYISQILSPNRVGHHNDCFLSNDTDYGTYSKERILKEKAYISQEGLYVPVGGETCPPTDGFEPNCAKSQSELAMLKWSYLNLDWFGPTLDSWRNSGCFDHIQRRLGYRFRLVSTELSSSLKRGQKLKVRIQLSNDGYAPIYHKKDVSLVLRNKFDGKVSFIPFDMDLRLCKPNTNIVYEHNLTIPPLKEGEYAIFLSIRDNSVKLRVNKSYNLRLANHKIWIADKGWNDLFQVLKVID